MLQSNLVFNTQEMTEEAVMAPSLIVFLYSHCVRGAFFFPLSCTLSWAVWLHNVWKLPRVMFKSWGKFPFDFCPQTGGATTFRIAFSAAVALGRNTGYTVFEERRFLRIKCKNSNSPLKELNWAIKLLTLYCRQIDYGQLVSNERARLSRDKFERMKLE